MMIPVLEMQDCAEPLLLSAVLNVLDLKEMKKVLQEVSATILRFMHLCFLSQVSLLSTAVTRSDS